MEGGGNVRDSMEEKLDRCLEALRPFSNLWDDCLLARAGQPECEVFGIQGNTITVGDVKRARIIWDELNEEE